MSVKLDARAPAPTLRLIDPAPHAIEMRDPGAVAKAARRISATKRQTFTMFVRLQEIAERHGVPIETAIAILGDVAAL